MKNITLFLSSILVGIAMIIITSRLTAPKNNQLIPSSQLPFTKFSIEKPPSDSIIGKITSISGEVNLQSRVATAPAAIKNPQDISQGEKIITVAGAAGLNFPNVGTVMVSSNTEIDIIQTLPSSAVFLQSSGDATYQKSSSTPISVRALHLLVQINSGSVELSLNSDQSALTVTAIKGNATLAYNDNQNTTQVMNLLEGKKASFDDSTRSVIVKAI